MANCTVHISHLRAGLFTPAFFPYPFPLHYTHPSLSLPFYCACCCDCFLLSPHAYPCQLLIGEDIYNAKQGSRSSGALPALESRLCGTSSRSLVVGGSGPVSSLACTGRQHRLCVQRQCALTETWKGGENAREWVWVGLGKEEWEKWDSE